MDLSLFEKINDYEWRIPPHQSMRVPGVIFASEALLIEMDEKVYEQLTNVAKLPGIVSGAFAMPDAHWGQLADALFAQIPAGVGSKSHIRLSAKMMNAMLESGAKWAIKQGYGDLKDLEHIESNGCLEGALPDKVSEHAKERQKAEMGTLGSGNHYLEIQEVTEIYYPKAATAFGLTKGGIVVSIHCGSRGLGHQIGTDYLRSMTIYAERRGIKLADRELACAPIKSTLGEDYLGAMRAGANCALANREIITHFMRETFQDIIPGVKIKLVYDVSHNICKEEWHEINGKKTRLFVHRKGATRAFGPNHPGLPKDYANVGQPVIIGGSMGTASYVLVGTKTAEKKSFSSACHGAGRAMSRHQATKKWSGKQIIEQLARRGILIRSGSYRGVAEEAPEAYKDVTSVVNAAHHAGLAKKVAKLEPIVCIKG
ncbi:RtcB family protein [Legionella micdadei]|uniref:RtcB family protein n=1 Tax=Legionella micdadei TaxID=451 RepID=UPI003A8074C9